MFAEGGTNTNKHTCVHKADMMHNVTSSLRLRNSFCSLSYEMISYHYVVSVIRLNCKGFRRQQSWYTWHWHVGTEKNHEKSVRVTGFPAKILAMLFGSNEVQI